MIARMILMIIWVALGIGRASCVCLNVILTSGKILSLLVGLHVIHILIRIRGRYFMDRRACNGSVDLSLLPERHPIII